MTSSIWTLALFIKLINNPSLRALAKQSRSELQSKIELDCFTSFAKTTILSLFSKRDKVQSINFIKIMNVPLILILIIIADNALATTPHRDNIWFSATGFGHLQADSPYFYQIETHLRFNTTGRIFRQNLEVVRLGKELNPYVSFVIGSTFAPTEFRGPGLSYEQRVWQQIDLNPPLSVPDLRLQVYDRMEERWLLNRSSGISLRNRFKIVVTYCKNDWLTCPLLASETFFNLNHPPWDNSNTLSQQRSFLGLQKSLTTKTLIRAGYLNQYFWQRNNSGFFNILDLQLAYNFD